MLAFPAPALVLPAPTLFLIVCLALYALRSGILHPCSEFLWRFLRPIRVVGQKACLEKTYEGQADTYDMTRDGLLRGRNTMLSLSAAHLKSLRAAEPGKRLVWIDIGGGTGHNIELMNKHLPILESFDAVYVVDLCEPLLDIARKRFAKKGWTNVHVLCQDAAQFRLPGWTKSKEPRSVGFVTFSYSLSMISSFYTVLDRVEHVLCPKDGLIAVVDFYTAAKQPLLRGKATSEEFGWLPRWFWQIWFDLDHVSLGPARRSYLEYKFGTVKTLNGRNRFILPFIRIPYYIWLGRSRSCDVSRACRAFEVEGGNLIGSSPAPSKTTKKIEELLPSPLLGHEIIPPFTAFHYHLHKSWRLPYYEQPIHKEFRTFIYSFTWEDPSEDMRHLQLSSSDSMFVITSAGDNALHYAIASRPQRIHCVDMNPCQGHLMELKLAGIQSLDYDDFFALFGKGQHSNFRGLLDSKLAPHLSFSAYQFWRSNSHSFSSSFYLRGYSGWALRMAGWIFRAFGVSKEIQALCTADTLKEQEEIWNTKLRPVLLNPIVVALLKNPVFCWNALGVPLNQRRMLLDEGNIYEFIRDTLDPVISTYLLKTGNYFYLLALLGHYTPESCPEYLTRAGFGALKTKNGKVLDAFRLHTDSIVNVLRGLSDWSLTRAMIMDHLDWFTPGSSEINDEVTELHRVLAPGGFVFWRSAARKPWYNVNFERQGFQVTALGVRKGEGGPALDRVNMYASFWRAVKI
ncbi:hypothetical protein K438DRAFT_1809216 [Mycena galopus ATCC 62051]|nr:hypothetical protein K438DRAFT_1809216 [Mycena galopus ATCC 62051]